MSVKHFYYYSDNLKILKNAHKENLANEFIVSGIFLKYKVVFDFAVKVLKELLRYEGCSVGNSGSPREIIKEAYKMYDCIEEEVWLSMLRDRNDLTHIYDGEQAQKLVNVILEKYIPAFVVLQENIEDQYKDVLDKL